MKLSLFKIGLILVVSGSIWIAVIFENNERVHDEVSLKQSTSFEIKSSFIGSDIGFYRVFMPEFDGEEIFVQTLDPNENILEEKKIQTKLSVGYFDYNTNGIHTIKITNISKNSVYIQLELGDTNSKEMIPAGILILVGSITLIIMSYFKLRNYNMAQPDENIS
ncbi:hypothetical protein [Nitrosopumilus sp.]|uniref:hypothetical protein n=1 Tax=Nitrosopumilus sp. TaxID=2024843 RepID=UPI002638B8A7|nr:hypothetical protein [Nitrosopumilus sp.]